MTRTTADLVAEALEHVDALRKHVAVLGLDHQAGFDAVCLRLAVAIDCIAQLPPVLRDTVCGGSWPSVRATRNRIVHGYFTVDAEVVRMAVDRDVGPLRARLLAGRTSCRRCRDVRRGSAATTLWIPGRRRGPRPYPVSAAGRLSAGRIPADPGRPGVIERRTR
ncbi:HepT-like ribonuclease domain-containing protein [Cellulomonas hominis]|uniref:HepT-like ribonuclease domain-containing protein n=1 Tax=Cellulomonas hominis TaxID=156981 RepID=UPI001B9FEA84|nr:HepT-like ribonuclease domain-containing protein [Cellulomonas hominis]VTR77574.1 hypothetical protein CHMI_02345 [Cellulomonas hominis]